MAADTGTTAPDFTLTNHDRQPVTLSQQRGRPVVLEPRGWSIRIGQPVGAAASAPGQRPRHSAARAPQPFVTDRAGRMGRG